jgi:hypothetical protein
LWRGFGEAASGRWENAVPFMEKALKFSIVGDLPKGFLAAIYAQVGRIQEAKALLNDWTKELPASMKNVRSVMLGFWLKDLQALGHWAEGFIKAGLPGEPSGFYKISVENRMTGEEIRELFFERKVTGINMASGKQWWVERSRDGKATVLDGDDSDNGKSWIEEDMLCDQWDNLYEGLKDCWVVYRNPEGTPEKNDEYLGAPGYGIYPFSQIE